MDAFVKSQFERSQYVKYTPFKMEPLKVELLRSHPAKLPKNICESLKLENLQVLFLILNSFKTKF